MQTIHIDSNLTPREVLRQLGHLPEPIAETVLDKADFADEAGGIACDVREGVANIPEDFAQSIIDDLAEFAKRLRGNNREDLRAIMFRLDDLQSDMARDAEYRVEKLNAAIDALEEF